MPTDMPRELLRAARDAKGFMPDDEGLFLFERGVEQGGDGPLLEIGTYCGKSAIYLGAAARATGTTVFTVDHHRGSEENQAGWEHHDPTLVDPDLGLMDALPVFRRTIADAGLEDEVVAIIGRSATVARSWSTPASLLFIDGGPGEEPAHTDYESWARWVQPGGLLIIHDVFPDPRDGGRPPYEIYLPALDHGFGEVGGRGTARAFRGVAGAAGDPVSAR